MVEDLSSAVYAESMRGDEGDAMLLEKFGETCDMPTIEQVVQNGDLKDLTSKCVRGWVLGFYLSIKFEFVLGSSLTGKCVVGPHSAIATRVRTASLMPV